MKKIFFSHLLVFGLLLSCIPMPLQSSSWGHWATQGRDWAAQGLKRGASSLYDYMSNISPQWVTSFINRLSEDNRWALFLALAMVLGVTGKEGYKYIQSYEKGQKEITEDIKTRAAAALYYNFQNNNGKFYWQNSPNLNNIGNFFLIVDEKLKPKSENEEEELNSEELSLVTPARLFRAFIYPLLEYAIKNKRKNLSDKDFWNIIINCIRNHFQPRTPNLAFDDNPHYLTILKNKLEQFMKNNKSTDAQEILDSLKTALET